jgi:hypothetical protein
MNERDKKLVKQAGLNIDGYDYPIWGCLDGEDEKKEFLEKFADLIRADEREACALLLESRKTGANELMDATRDMDVRAIRARGNT